MEQSLDHGIQYRMYGDRLKDDCSGTVLFQSLSFAMIAYKNQVNTDLERRARRVTVYCIKAPSGGMEL